MRTVFVINSISGGGAERVLAEVLRHAPTGTGAPELHLVVLDRIEWMREMPSSVTVHQLDAGGRLVPSVWQLRRLLDRLQPDLVIGFLIRANVAALLAGFGRAWPVIVCERMHMGSHLRLRHEGWKRALAAYLPRRLYRRAERVLAVSEGVRENLIAEFGTDPARTLTVPNPYDRAKIVEAGAQPPDVGLPADFVVAVGRLVAAKDFALTIRAFALARPAETLLILGEGPDQPMLERIAASAGVADHVRFLGYAANPFAIVSRARFLVSASRNEGFPNAIAEAMVLGVPVIATDCPSGPRELLEDGRHGLLIPMGDVEAMVGAMIALEDPERREHFAHSARRRMDDFAAEAITGRYWAIFSEVARSRPRTER